MRESTRQSKFLVVVGTIPVACPLPDIAGHVIQAVRIGRVMRYRGDSDESILSCIGVGEMSLMGVGHPFSARTELVSPDEWLAGTASSGGKFPLRFGWQSFSDPFCISYGVFVSAWGGDNTHWRTGTSGMTRSTRCAAVPAIRRPPQDGHMPRDLQENATTRSSLQVSQPIRRKPRASTPQSRNDRNSFSAKPGTSIFGFRICSTPTRIMRTRILGHRHNWNDTGGSGSIH
jgi:hypothetical protein